MPSILKQQNYTWRDDDEKDKNSFTAKLHAARDASGEAPTGSFTERLRALREDNGTMPSRASQPSTTRRKYVNELPTVSTRSLSNDHFYEDAWAHQRATNGLAGSYRSAARAAAEEEARKTAAVRESLDRALPFGTYSTTFRRDEGKDLVQRAAMNRAWDLAKNGPEQTKKVDMREVPLSELSVPANLNDPFGAAKAEDEHETNPLLATPDFGPAEIATPDVPNFNLPDLQRPKTRYDSLELPKAPVQTENRRDPEEVANEMTAAALRGPNFSYSNTRPTNKIETGDAYTDRVINRLFDTDGKISEYIKAHPDADLSLLDEAMLESNGVETPREVASDPTRHWVKASPIERSVAFYLANTGQNEKLTEYVNALKPVLEKRTMQDAINSVQEFAGKNPFNAALMSAASVLMAPTRGVSYIGQAIDMAGDGKIDEYADYNMFSRVPDAIRNKVSSDIADGHGAWGKFGAFGYQTAMSMGDFLYTALVSGGFSGGLTGSGTAAAQKASEALSLGIMGTGAAASSTIEAKERGLSDKQAFALGTIAGLAEVVTEKVSLEALLKPDYSQGALKYILKNALAEGSEEVASDLINVVADTLIAADKSKLRERVNQLVAEEGISESEAFGRALAEQAGETALSFLGGAISGGVMAGAGSAINWTNFQQAKQEFAAANGMTTTQVDTLTDILNDTDTERQSARLNALAKDVAGETRSNLDRAARLYAEEQQARTAEGRIALVEQALAQDPVAQNISEAGRRTISENWNGNKQDVSEYVRDMESAYFAGVGGEDTIADLVKDRIVSEDTPIEALQEVYRDGRKQAQVNRIQASEEGRAMGQTGVQSSDEIMTFREAVDWAEQNNAVTDEMRDALKTGQIEVYSVGDLKNGTAVFLDEAQAQDYAETRGGQVVSTTVPTNDVAWSDYNYGQYTGDDYVREDTTRGIEGRADGESAGVTVRGVEGRTGRFAGAAERSGIYETRQELQKSAKRKISAASLIENGSTNSSVTEIEYKAKGMPDDVNRAASLLMRAGFREENIHFYVGDLRGKDNMRVQGFTDGEHVWVQADNNRFTAEQIAGHEAMHRLIKNGSVSIESVRSWMRTNAPEATSLIEAIYQRSYKGLNGIDLWEEAICDAAGGINIHAARYNFMQGLLRSAMPSLQTAIEQTSGKTVEEIQGGEVGSQFGEKKHSIAVSDEGETYVNIDENAIDLDNGASIARNIASLLSEKFGNRAIVNGQFFQLNKKTSGEYRYSNWAKRLRQDHPGWYRDKIKSLANADEVLTAAKGWVNEELKHERRDDITSFGRGQVLYKVGERGYSADVLVGIRQNGAAVLYDLINIEQHKITDSKSDGGAVSRTPRASESVDLLVSQKNSVVKRSVEADPEVLQALNSEPTVTVYRAMQVIDGKLYPPMAAKVDGALVEPTETGVWYRADERPDLIKNGKFKLDKANGSAIEAAYNPYWHTSRSMLNDQFSSAYKRPNLVTVECEVPASELSSGYKAEYAKDSVGEMQWHSGPVSSKLAKLGDPRRVILSRWVKVNRIVSDVEAARQIAKTLEGTGIAVPENTVTPSLRSELEKRGVTIATNSRLKASAEAMDADSVEMAARNAGYTIRAYHGSPATDITSFDIGRAGRHTGVSTDRAIWFTDNEKFADSMSYEQLEGNSSLTYKRGKKGKVYDSFLKMEHPFDIRNMTDEMRDDLWDMYRKVQKTRGLPVGTREAFDTLFEGAGDQFVKFHLDYDMLRERGYDGVIARISEKDGTEYGVFSPEQVKSADPVTYDDSGNVIPISERFNSADADIRYSAEASSYTGDNSFYGETSDGRKFSLKSLNTDITEGRMRQDLIDSGFGEDETDALFKGLEKLAKYIAEPGRVEILDLNETEGRDDRVYKPYKPNSDPLYVISLDYSTMCRKRLMTQFVIEHLQLEMHRVMSAEEQLAIRDKLNEYREQETALQVACAMCYVEAARLKSPAQIQKYFADPGAYVSKYLAIKDKNYDSYIEKVKGDVKEALGHDRDATKKQMGSRDATTLNGITQKLRSGKDYSALTSREKAAITEEQYKPYEPSGKNQQIIEDAKNLSVDNYLSAANLTRLATRHPEIYAAYTSHVRASTHSKGIESDVAYYYGDADTISDSFIESVNKENGMRSNSWSDFQFTHLLDQIVATIELHNRGASMHAYTKFLEQVRIFGNTGEMFNLSGVPAQVGVDADGNLQFSDTESVHVNMSEEHLETVRKIRDAFAKLRSENPGKRFTIDDALEEAGIDELDDYDALIAREEFTQTAGLQSIAMNEKHLRALLRSELVDYVIPYHKSGMNATLRKMAKIYHWTDFEKMQSEKGDGATPVFSDWMLPESEWGNKTGIEIMRESADRYLALCKERGLTPKFADYTNEDNYWKLLIDRKMIDQQSGRIIKQQVVKPDFDFSRIEAEIDQYVSNYDPNLENKALDYIRNNWDAVQASIPELKKGKAARLAIQKANNAEQKMRNAAMRVDDLSNQVLVAEVKYSSEADSEGRSLSRRQAEYFKDSKIRDEDGNLQVVYHGTDADFTVFDRTKGRSTMDIQGSFFSPWDIDAAGYGSNVQAYYLNIKNPAPESVAYAALNRFKGQNNAGIKAREYLESRGYDGVNNGDEEYIAFYPEQIKKVDNASPTSNADVRYSMEAEDQGGDGYSELTDTISELRAELKKQTARAEHFKAETRLSQNRGQIDEASAEKFTRSILKAYQSKADFNTTKAGVTEYANWMRKTFNELRTVDDEQRWADFEDEAYTRAVDLMRPVVLNTETLLNEDAVEIGKDIRSYLKSGRGISISDADQRAVYTLGYDNFNDFRRRNFGNLKITKDGPRVDQVWSELQDQFGKDFFPDDIYNALEQLERISEVLSELEPIYGNPFVSNAFNAEEAVDYAARDVVSRVLRGEVKEVAPTFSDKMHDRIDAAQKEAVRRVQEVRQEARAKTEEKLNALKSHYAEMNKNRSTLTQMSKERQRLLKIARRLMNRKMPAVNKAWVEETIGNLDLAATSITGRKIKNLMDLSDWYEEQKQNPDFIPMPQIEKQLQRLVKRQMGSARDAFNAQKAGLGFDGMTQEEVLDLTEALLNFEHQLDTRDKLINSEDRRSVYAMTLEVLTDIEKSRGINFGRDSKRYMGVRNFVIDETLNPRSTFRRIAGYNENDPLYQRYVELNEGQHAMMTYEMNALGEFDEWMNDKEFQRDHAGRHAKTVTATFGGKEVTMTRDVLISLYMHSLNDDNMRHIARSGIDIPDAQMIRKNNLQRAYEKTTRVRIQPSEMKAFFQNEGKLTDKEMSFIRAMQKYFEETSKKDLNRVSLDLYGFERANEENYWPIEVNTNFLRQDANALFKLATTTGEITMDPGFLQVRKVESGEVIIGRGALDVLQSAIHKNANFIGMAIPIRNFSKLYSTKSVSFEELPSFRGQAFAVIDQGSVRDLIQKKWGEQANKYIVKLMNDMQGLRAKDEEQFVQTLRMLRSNYAGAVLTFNLSVALKQTASYPTAAAVIGWRPLLKAFKLTYNEVDRVDLDLIRKYTPLLDYRRKGFTDTERGELAQRNIHVPAALNWIQGMDVLTTQKLWRACEYYVQDNFKALERRSDPYYRKVAEIYNRVIEETQPNYTTMQRPGNLRGNFIITSINMFKTQPFQNFNILYDAFGNYAAKRSALKTATDENIAQAKEDFKQARMHLWNSVSSIAVSTIVFAAATFAWGLLRKKKEPEEAGKEMAQSMVSSLVGMVPLLNIPLDLISAHLFGGKYWGYETVTAGSINDFTEGVDKIITAWDDGKQVKVKDVANLAFSISQLFGLPLSNVVNLLNIGFAWAGLGSLQDFLQDGIAPSEANYVWEQRRKAGVTTKQIAEACGVQESTVRGWQSGKIPNMKKESKEKLANLLGISVNELNREIELSKGDD